MSRRIALSVNNKPIEPDYFVQGFIDHTTGGIVEALEGTGKIKTLRISIEANEVKITYQGGVLCQMRWQLSQESSRSTMLSGSMSNLLETQ